VLETGNLDPSCDQCGGFVKPATVSFGQPMPEQEMIRAFDHTRKSDLLIMIGSSLQVEPAASIPREAHRTGAKLIYINRTPTPTDNLANVLFREDAGEVMELMVEGL